MLSLKSSDCITATILLASLPVGRAVNMCLRMFGEPYSRLRRSWSKRSSGTNPELKSQKNRPSCPPIMPETPKGRNRFYWTDFAGPRATSAIRLARKGHLSAIYTHNSSFGQSYDQVGRRSQECSLRDSRLKAEGNNN